VYSQVALKDELTQTNQSEKFNNIIFAKFSVTNITSFLSKHGTAGFLTQYDKMGIPVKSILPSNLEFHEAENSPIQND
jgi:hypothetical protein